MGALTDKQIEDIPVFPYETLEAKGDVWIRVTDSLKSIQQALADQRTQLIQEFKENKRTMAHIEGVKRVETDYILLADAIKLIEGKE